MKSASDLEYDRIIHAAAQAKLRAKKKAKVPRECRQCSNPAAVAPDGRVMSACNKHLDADVWRQKNRRLAKKAKAES